MVDEETKTLWSQLLAKGMEGKHKGDKLPVLPSVLTDWASWKKSYPKTTVIKLSRTGREFRNDFYSDPAKFVVGLSKLNIAKAWPFDQLRKQPLVNDEFDKRDVLIYFVGETSAAYVYDRKLEGTTLEFKFNAGKVVDGKTQTEWDLSTGVAIAGKMKGKRLKALPAIPSFRKSWMTFYPNSEVWELK